MLSRLSFLVGVLSVLLVPTQSSRTPGSRHSRPEETCFFSPFGKSRKIYHFQLVGDEGSNLLIRFNRDPERPTYDIKIGASWSAWLPAPWFAEDESDLELQFAPLPDDSTFEADARNVRGAGTAEQTYVRRQAAEDGAVVDDDSVEDGNSSNTSTSANLTDDGFLTVDIFSLWRYARRVRLGVGPDGVMRPNGLEIGLEEGRGTTAFGGGAYYPKDVSKRSLWNVMKRSLVEEPGPNETLPELLHGRVGLLYDSPGPPGRDSMFGLRAADLPQIPTSLQSAASPLFTSISSGVTVDVIAATPSFGIGSVIGVAISSVTSLTNLDQRWDDLWQMELVASEKLFDKLWCSGLFTRCPGPDDVIVPPGKECPVFE